MITVTVEKARHYYMAAAIVGLHTCTSIATYHHYGYEARAGEAGRK